MNIFKNGTLRKVLAQGVVPSPAFPGTGSRIVNQARMQYKLQSWSFFSIPSFQASVKHGVNPLFYSHVARKRRARGGFARPLRLMFGR
jgi:hypothetical protein